LTFTFDLKAKIDRQRTEFVLPWDTALFRPIQCV